jgi:transmembrane sensor
VNKSDPTASEIARLQDASEWVQRLNESNAEEVADQWMQWCGADPLNLPAFERMQHLWNALPEARATTLHPVLNRPKHRNRLIAMAACVVLLLGVAGWFAWQYSDEQVLVTAVGEQRRITLADGSHLDLAPGSRVITHFTLAKRDVRLERGQAFFQVAHKSTRPFIVHTNNLTVTAVGTEFDVRISPDATAVTVMEGRIKVSPDAETMDQGGTRTEIIRADIGQRVTFSKSAHQFSVGTVDPKVASSWRGGTLQFVGESLEDVVGHQSLLHNTHRRSPGVATNTIYRHGVADDGSRLV